MKSTNSLKHALRNLIFSFTVLAAPASLRAENAFELMVTADRVNLRNEATLESEVVGQANYGDRLTGLETSGEWIRVRSPESIAVWVHGGLLFEDREVRARVLNMRNGPGTQYAVLGQFERGDAVTVLEDRDEWRRVAATDATRVWIHTDFVEHIHPPVAAVEPVAEEPDGDLSQAEEMPEEGMEIVEPAEEPAAGDEIFSEAVNLESEEEEAPGDVAVEVVEDAAAAEDGEEEILTGMEPGGEPETIPEAVGEEADAVIFADLPEPEMAEAPGTPGEIAVIPGIPLVPLEGQGTASVRRGWVKAYVIAGSAPSRFQLVYRDRRGEEALCYLHGDEAQLRQLSNRFVLLRGRDFWVKGQRLPLMRIESISVLPESAE